MGNSNMWCSMHWNSLNDLPLFFQTYTITSLTSFTIADVCIFTKQQSKNEQSKLKQKKSISNVNKIA